MRLREEGLQTRHLRVCEPEKTRNVRRSFLNRESRRQSETNGP